MMMVELAELLPYAKTEGGCCRRYAIHSIKFLHIATRIPIFCVCEKCKKGIATRNFGELGWYVCVVHGYQWRQVVNFLTLRKRLKTAGMESPLAYIYRHCVSMCYAQSAKRGERTLYVVESVVCEYVYVQWNAVVHFYMVPDGLKLCLFALIVCAVFVYLYRLWVWSFALYKMLFLSLSIRFSIHNAIYTNAIQ